MIHALPLAVLLILQGGPPTRPATIDGVDTRPDQAGVNFYVRQWWHYINPTPDSAITSVRDGAMVLLGTPHRLRVPVARDSFALTRPAAGTSRTGFICVQTKRSAASDTSATVCKPWAYTEPVGSLPPPVIDSVRADTLVVALKILPHSVALTAPAGLAFPKQQFCPVYTMGDGKKIMRTEYMVLPYCKGLYEAWVPLLERGTSAQRLFLDGHPQFRVAL
jgi:hypothetical protein